MSGIEARRRTRDQGLETGAGAIVVSADGAVPSFTTFDLAVGYDLGDRRQNDYLKKINFECVRSEAPDHRLYAGRRHDGIRRR